MSLNRMIAAAACCFALAGGAHAATHYPTFEVDMGSTWVTAGDETVATPFVNVAGAWTPQADGDSLFIPDFWDWSDEWSPDGATDVTATITLSRPTGGLTSVLEGSATRGNVAWDGPAEFAFDDGSVLRLDFASRINYGYVNADASFVAGPEVAPVPLPAAGVMLMSVLGGLGLFARRSKA